MNHFTMKPSEVRQSLLDCFAANLVPFVRSSPGLGKSALHYSIAEEHDLELIDIRLSQHAPEDLTGLPMRSADGKHAEFAPFSLFPTESTKLPKGKKGWLLFLDEFNSASKSVQAAAYKLVLDRMVGQHKLHELCWVSCAGNLETDKAIVNQLSTATQSRLVHIEMVVDHGDFMDHARQNGFDHRVLGFLDFAPNKLHHFNPDHDDYTFPCPRTWEFASRLIKDVPVAEVNLKLLAGTVSKGTATEFYTFLQEYTNLPRFRDVVADPNGIPVPPNPATRYALISMLAFGVTTDNFEEVAIYVKRLPPEFQIIFSRMVMGNSPKLFRNPEFAKLLRELNQDVTKFMSNAA